MTWLAPAAARTKAPAVCAERASLEARLDYHRATLLRKCEGLTGEQLALRAAEPSGLSLLGLVRHLADAERAWFRKLITRPARFQWLYSTGEHPDAEWVLADPAHAAEDFAIFAAECEASRTAASRFGLDDTFPGPRGAPVDLRWVYLHMIEEYARHNGHADLLRERIDGATGA
jgi:Protein of unknown function (DUF664)